MLNRLRSRTACGGVYFTLKWLPARRMAHVKRATRFDCPPSREVIVTRVALLLSLAILISLTLSPLVAATFEVVGADTSKTATLAANSHAAYQLLDSSSNVVDVGVTADGFVDFYVMNNTGYNEYIDPNSALFHTVDGASQENVTSFTYSTLAYKGRILVVDNEDFTNSGASGSQTVTYTITISFAAAQTGGPTLFSITMAALAGGAVFGAIAVVVWRQRKKKQAAQTTIPAAPQQFLPPAPPASAPLPPPPGFQPGFMTAPVSAVPQPAGTIVRTKTSAEYGVLVQDFKKQKGKLLILPIMGLVLSLVLMTMQDWTLSPLVLFALMSPIAIGVLHKYRSAIASGNVIEYRGIPTAISAETLGKRQFYQVLFGSTTLRILPSLYGRFVQNQPNTLAVFEKAKGQTVAIAVNGTPLSAPLNEPVEQIGGPKISAGSGTTPGALGAT